jgi:membrane-bound ClpP family serine protease
MVGTVRRELDPTGMVYLNGELWTATAMDLGADRASLTVGTRVEVTAIHGLRLEVRETASQSASSTKGPLRNRGASVIPVKHGLGRVDP